MAGNSYAGTVYGKDGSILYNTGAGLWGGSMTISDVLGLSWNSSGEVTELSKTAGGTALNPSTTLDDLNMATIELYDVTLGPGCHREDDYSAMRGPCPAGFHVPLKTERQALYNAGESLGLRTSSSGAINCSTYLKLPFAGRRDYHDGSYKAQSTNGYYWSSSHESGTSWISYYFYIYGNGGVTPQDSQICTDAYSIRCFKDSPVEPDDSWTKIYDGSSVVSGAGIFHNTTLGLISLSGDGTTWYTIQDKNLGATQVYNYGDTLSEANCGKYYQWGNNYGFPRTGTVTTSSTRVDASNYGPGNYYSGSTFIIRTSNPRGWYSGSNHNLWGGETGVTYTEICPTYRLHGYIGTWHMEWVPEVKDYSAMQGPAPSGFHVPLQSERQSIYGILINTFGLAKNSTTMGTYLKMPMAGCRDYSNANVYSVGSVGFYWSSTRYNSADYAYCLFFSSNLSPRYTNHRAYSFSVRCFKDTPTIPTSSWTKLYDGSSIATGAGVFWSSTDGLISVSGDGVTWYTIMDKNLGATTVYNQGNTLTDANCGNFYQWGNNYGFPHSGTVTTSSTKVDASNYGPGNYYNSSTFIIVSASPYDWSSVRNANLRGGETGIIIIPGHYRPRGPVVKLKTYEEIVAMATAEGYPWTNTLVELNTDIDGYRTSLSDYIQFRVSASGYVLYGIYDSGYYIGYYNYSPYTWQALEDD